MNIGGMHDMDGLPDVMGEINNLTMVPERERTANVSVHLFGICYLFIQDTFHIVLCVRLTLNWFDYGRYMHWY